MAHRLAPVSALMLLLAPGFAHAASDEDLERALLEALRPVPELRRQENAGKAIRRYKAAGIIPLRPAARIDYTDYYQVRRPMSFLGNARELAKGLNLPAPLRPGRYAWLHCHDRDELGK